MDLNYLAFFLISFVPIILAKIWYHPNSWILKKARSRGNLSLKQLKWYQWLLAFLMSVSIVYGFMNLVIHQLGFYELFFTDIMKGSAEAKLIVEEFLGKYGRKHRSFGHGVFHGAINAVVVCWPIVLMTTFLDRKENQVIWVHFSYWLVTSMLVCGLIAEFV